MTASEALVRYEVDVLAEDVRLQHLWLATRAGDWRSLAIVAASPNVSTLYAASTLANVAWRFSGEPSSIFDLRDVSMRLLEPLADNIRARVAQGDRVFIALRSADENPTAIPLARAADAALLCVALGETPRACATRIVNAIGREHFVGSILVPAEVQG